MNNNQLIKNLISNLALGNIIQEPIRIDGGLLNKLYKVYTTTGTYAIKLLNPEVMKREKSKENHIIAEQIANVAKDNGVNCLPAKIINSTVLHEVDGSYFLIFDWFEGNPIISKEITLEHVKKVASLLSKIHSIDFGELKDTCNLGKEIPEVDWDFYISKLENQELKELLLKYKDKFIELDKKSTLYAKEIRNSVVVSHRDLDLPNILWDKNDNPMIIDWESSGVVNPCEEVVETAWDWAGCSKVFDIEKFKYFLKVYKDNGGDLSDFNKAIISNFKNKAGWLEYNLKRVCRLECLDDEEQKLGEKESIRVIHEITEFYSVLENFVI